MSAYEIITTLPDGSEGEALSLTFGEGDSYRMPGCIPYAGVFTFSVWAKGGEITLSLSNLAMQSFALGEDWQRVHITGEFPEKPEESFNYAAISGTGTVTVCMGQVEEGNLPSTWQESPEDGEEKTQNLVETLRAEQIITNNEILDRVSEQKQTIDAMTGEVVDLQEKYLEVSQTAEALNAKVSKAGGVNLVKNSAGLFGLDSWETEGEVYSYQGNRVSGLTVSQSGFLLDGSSFSQEGIQAVSGGVYTLAFIVSKRGYAASCRLSGAEKDLLIDLSGEKELMEVTETFTALSSLTISFSANAGSDMVISDLRIVPGEEPLTWQPASGEIKEENLSFSSAGFSIENPDTKRKSMVVSDGFIGFYNGEKTFYMDQEYTVSKRGRFTEQIELSPMKILPGEKNGVPGWAFVPMIDLTADVNEEA